MSRRTRKPLLGLVLERLAAGQYQPEGLFDLFYGKLDAATQKEAPPLSYFSRYYD